MILATHFLAGAAIASKISNPGIALAAALTSHFVLDMVPHDEYPIDNIRDGRWNKSFGDFSRITLDLLFAILMTIIFTKSNFFLLLAGTLAIAPDGISLFLYFFPQSKIFFFLDRIQENKIHLWAAKKKLSVKKPLECFLIIFKIINQPIIILLALFFLAK
ncbi:MAG: hypothetical protein ABIF89_02345 [bacterium]